MASQTYNGRIWLKTGEHAISVTTVATSGSAAAKIILAQYGSNFKQWAKHMSSN
ncbi:MAG: hypothetical protein QNK20_09490 [Aureibaculum sp.]|nr:hypothetical protein [Aureibaculum sp.]